MEHKTLYYSLITKPYLISLGAEHHTLAHQVTLKFIDFKKGAQFWCARVKSYDHVGGESLLIFSHSFLASFKAKTEVLPNKWTVLDQFVDEKEWKMDISILEASYPTLEILTNGQELPKFEKK